MNHSRSNKEAARDRQQSKVQAPLPAASATAEQNKVGPHLSGVFGRTAGTIAGARYSKAMTASGMTWDEQTLDAFLTEPTKALPGTTMSVRLPNPQDRADVIAYLKTLASP
jgi:cytochrome c